MDLTQLKVTEFADLLGSAAPAPGGGAAAALSGVTGIALTQMVAALTIGKEKYKEYEPLMLTINEEADKLRADLLNGMNRDAEAYSEVSKAYKMPKDTPEEKETRSQAIQKALKHAATVPVNIMEYSLQGLVLTEKALGHSNPNVVSDLGAAALMLKSSVQTAWLNVLANLSGIQDKEFTDERWKAGDDILKQALPISYKIYDEIVSMK